MSTTLPPSSSMPIVKVTRVQRRLEQQAHVAPGEGGHVRRRRAAPHRLQVGGEGQRAVEIVGRVIEQRQEVLGHGG
ncbi:MAG: hypothetical protein R2708_14565 [Vicinamibacterales bacterium]